MRLQADMGVSQQVVEWLRMNGHDAVHLIVVVEDARHRVRKLPIES